MNINDLLHQGSEWLKGSGPHSDIVISSRIRLARNLQKNPFPQWANKKQAEHTFATIHQALSKIENLSELTIFKLAEMDSIDKQFLIERHLMSHEHAQKSNHKAVAVEKNETISIMINEEDHLRMQVMQSGLNLQEAWKIIDGIDNALSKELPFAYNQEWGYLTACPTNTGTGMRGSVMLHLPALVITRQINRVLAAIAKLSFTTRGLYGEGTQATGNFFQISNQVSLGRTELELLENINGIIRQIIEQENQARELLFSREKAILEDKINRSFGILRSAHIISSQETIELLSMVRLGCDLGMIKDINRSVINELFVLTQPAHLQKLEAKKLTSEERDIKRAEIVRSKLGVS